MAEVPKTTKETESHDDDSDDLDEDEVSASQGQAGQGQSGPRQSFGLRTKKFWASKASSSKMGRKAIGHFLGEEGNKLLSTVKNAVKKDQGVGKAREVKTLIIKMALKGKLLQDEGLIRKKDVWKMAEPLNTAALSFYGCVRPRVEKRKSCEDDEGRSTMASMASVNLDEVVVAAEEKKTDEAELLQLTREMALVRDLCVELFRGHITPANATKLHGVFDYLCGRDFLDAFMNDAKLSDEKMISFNSLRHILKPLLESRNYNADMQELCKVEGCDDFAVVAYQDFAGSSRCLAHHHAAHTAFVAQPFLLHFVDGDGMDYYPFQEQCKKKVERWIRKLYASLIKYRTHPKQTVRPIFADELWKKYLKPKAQYKVTVDGVLLAAVEKDLKSGRPDLFADIEKVCRQRLEEFFQDFKQTSEYTDYITKVYALPEYLQEDLAKEKKKKKK